MPTYLTVTAQERDHVVGLGACRDQNSGRLFVPDGMAVTAFASWLPSATGSEIATMSPPGISLTTLLRRVETVVNRAFPQPEWVRIEISEIGGKGGHLYLVATDRDEDGNEISKCKAIIWSSQANMIGAKFFKMTGSQLTAGIKVLVLVQPNFKVQHGLGLVISDIDPSYTLGDMEARLKKIRATLQVEGIADKNRSLPSPSDFFRVAVIAPASAAGLEDFQVDANRLSAAGLCEFTYFHATFQGDHSKQSLRQAFIDANELHKASPIDSLVIIRGGGAAADLHWLNEELLARMVCRFPAPVITGIGHERDTTILDECANQRCGTPSKVIIYISRAIARNAQCALRDWNEITQAAMARLSHAEAKATQMRATVCAGVDKRLDRALFATEQNRRNSQSDAMATLELAGVKATTAHTAITAGAVAALSVAHKNVDYALMNIRERTWSAVNRMDADINNNHDAITLAARRSIDGIAEHLDERWVGITSAVSNMADNLATQVDRVFGDIRCFAKRNLVSAEVGAREVMEGILAHGLAPTLKRGFAIVRAGDVPVSSKAASMAHKCLNIEFRDGSIAVYTEMKE